MRSLGSHTLTLPNDNRSNGLTERCNRTMLQAIRKLWSDRFDAPWWDLIKIGEGQLNGGFHGILGMTPDEAWELRGDYQEKMPGGTEEKARGHV